MVAPPRHRRPGFSRRAQLTLFAGYVGAVIGIVAGIGLLLVGRFDPAGLALLRGTATDATAPIAEAGRALVRGVRGIASDGYAYLDAGSQNRALRAQLDAARNRLIAARAGELENRRLKALLRLTGTEPTMIAAGRIVGSSPTSSRRTAILSVGARAGVRPGQPVRAPEGLIGRVVETGQISARVLLLTDTSSTLPVRIARNGVAALAVGHGDGPLDIRPLVAGASPFRRGDILVTSGAGGLFPPGVPVAVVTRAGRDGAVAWPLADPARLDFATVERPFTPDLAPLPPEPARPR